MGWVLRPIYSSTLPAEIFPLVLLQSSGARGVGTVGVGSLVEGDGGRGDLVFSSASPKTWHGGGGPASWQ